MIKPMDVTPEIIDGLSSVRTWITLSHKPYLLRAFEALEAAGVFAEIDEAADRDRADAALAESAASDLAELQGARDHETLDPLAYLRAVNSAQTGA